MVRQGNFPALLRGQRAALQQHGLWERHLPDVVELRRQADVARIHRREAHSLRDRCRRPCDRAGVVARPVVPELRDQREPPEHVVSCRLDALETRAMPDPERDETGRARHRKGGQEHEEDGRDLNRGAHGPRIIRAPVRRVHTAKGGFPPPTTVRTAARLRGARWR
jgi:hypothetical protein